MKRTWHVLYRTRRGALPCVEADGPALARMVFAIAADLADSIHDGDTRAQAWSDWLITRSNLRAAMESGVEDVDTEQLADAQARAWAALEPELPSVLRLDLDEARILCDGLFEATGRVGEVRAA